MFLEVLLDSVKDTLELVPFLYLTYLAMEALEHGMEGRTERIVARAGKTGPLVGSLLGALPQCGFSAMAATLYAGRVVTVGTLVAVILATSDEMIPVFIAHHEPVARLLAIIGLKVAVGIAVGFAVDAVLRALHRAGDGKLHIKELCERDHCECDEEEIPEMDVPADGEGADGAVTTILIDGEWRDGAATTRPVADGAVTTRTVADDVVSPSSAAEDAVTTSSAAAKFASDSSEADGIGEGGAVADGTGEGGSGVGPSADHVAGHHEHHHDHHAHHGSKLAHIARSALIHTVQVTGFIFIVTLAFGLLIELVGRDALGAVLAMHPVRGTLLAALIGLIPNCGASVALTELYLAGTLPCGQMIAGLLVSGGVGLLVLFRTNADLRQNLLITAFIYAVGVVVGLIVGASGILL